MLLVEQNANIALELADYAYLIETGCIVMGGPAAIIACDHAVRRAYLAIEGEEMQGFLHQLIEPMIRAWSPSKLRSTKCLKAIL